MHESAVRKVTVIPADPTYDQKDIRKKHLRVAPYCRVSTSSEEQLDSYQAQIEYYTEKIAAQQEWTMVDMFADEGKTATSTKKRKDFLRMIKACEKGKVDLVITKSVSRFCRNTLDGLDYVRRLKRMGVGVFFEKENFLSENLSQKSGITQNTPRYAAITSETRGVFSLPKRAGV